MLQNTLVPWTVCCKEVVASFPWTVAACGLACEEDQQDEGKHQTTCHDGAQTWDLSISSFDSVVAKCSRDELQFDLGSCSDDVQVWSWSSCVDMQVRAARAAQCGTAPAGPPFGRQTSKVVAERPELPCLWMVVDEGAWTPAGVSAATAAAAAVPVEPGPLTWSAQQACRLVDLKGLAKLPAFTGEDADYQEWKFRFMVVMGLMELDPQMREAEALPTEVSWEKLSDIGRAQSRLVFSILAQVLQGRALNLLKLSSPLLSRPHGFEAWRCLVREYEPRLGARSVAQLSALLAPSFPEGGLVEAWRRWKAGAGR